MKILISISVVCAAFLLVSAIPSGYHSAPQLSRFSRQLPAPESPEKLPKVPKVPSDENEEESPESPEESEEKTPEELVKEPKNPEEEKPEEEENEKPEEEEKASEEQEGSNSEEDTKYVSGPRNEAEKMVEHQAEQHAKFFEGDILLTKKQEDAFAKMKKKANKGKKETITGNGRPFIGQKWPNGRVPYELSANFDQSRRNTLNEAIREFNNKTCIRFEEKRDSDRHWVRFIIDDRKCYSRLGKVDMRGQPISIGNGCNFVGTMIHEMMHCIGFFHEQSRRDRDEHVQILWDNIDTDRYGENIRSNFEMYEHGEGDTLGEAYDLGSVMHYPNKAFGKFDSRGIEMDTIRAIANPNLELGQRIGFSEGDLKQINLLYECRDFLDA